MSTDLINETGSGGAHYAQHDQIPDDEDPNILAAIEASRNYNYGAHAAGEPSTAAYGMLLRIETNALVTHSSSVGEYDYEDEGPPTPRPGNSRTSHIAATEGEAEQLDPRT